MRRTVVSPAAEAVLARSAIGGVLPEANQFGLLTTLNVAGTRLDYCLDRSVT